MTIPLNVGDSVPLGTILANIHLMGIATDPTNPNMFGATLEVFGDQGLLTQPVLQGPQGVPGAPQFALAFQNDSVADASDLPNDLTNTDADVGKYWVIQTVDQNGNVTGTRAYIWYGTEYRQMQMGTTGPPGPYPIITPTVNLLDPDQNSYITVSGSVSNPQWMLHLAVPEGPEGPSAALATCPDVNMSSPPQAGQVLGFNGQYTGTGQPIWQPMWVGDILPSPYTIPESAFVSYKGITGAYQTICTWQAPSQQWPWQPWVTGQVEVANSVDVSFNPSLVDVEVRINDPKTGPLIAKGIGNSTGAGSISIFPHTSTKSSPSTAMSQSNGYAQIAAGTSPNIYVNLVNQGLVTAFDYDNTNSQLNVVAMPVGTERALPTAYFGQFGGKGAVSATWELVSGG